MHRWFTAEERKQIEVFVSVNYEKLTTKYPVFASSVTYDSIIEKTKEKLLDDQFSHQEIGLLMKIVDFKYPNQGKEGIELIYHILHKYLSDLSDYYEKKKENHV